MKKTKNKNVSRTICNNSIDYIKALITNTKAKDINTKAKSNKSSYNNYNNYIKKEAHTFITSQHKVLTTLFNIKNTTDFTITYTIEHLDTSNSIYAIPHFIDIFNYLLTINEFLSHFTLDEQQILKDKLSSSKSNKSSKSIIECYTFLANSNIGIKLIKLYNTIIYTNTTFITNLITKFPTLKFHSLLINSFTSYKILEDLELNIKKVIKFSIVWKNKKLNNILYLFTYNKEEIPTTYIIKLGKDIIKRLLFFNEFLNTTKYPEHFIIFLTNKKKEIDKELIDQVHFKTININTAVTNTKDIIIYRKEEVFKSVFHELIHFHNLDFRTISPSHILTDIINYLITTHNINSNNEYLLYECITETLANILNNIYYSGDIKEMEVNLVKEIMFSTLQVSKILHLSHHKQWYEFSYNTKTTNTHTTKHKPIKFTQTSCVFSYYILKLYMLLNISSYFKTILDSKLKFIETEKTFTNLIKLIDNSRTNVVLKDMINGILKGLQLNKAKHYDTNTKKTKKNKKNKKTNSTTTTIVKTLRMTCL